MVTSYSVPSVENGIISPRAAGKQNFGSVYADRISILWLNCSVFSQKMKLPRSLPPLRQGTEIQIEPQNLNRTGIVISKCLFGFLFLFFSACSPIPESDKSLYPVSIQILNKPPQQEERSDLVADQEIETNTNTGSSTNENVETNMAAKSNAEASLSVEANTGVDVESLKTKLEKPYPVTTQQVETSVAANTAAKSNVAANANAEEGAGTNSGLRTSPHFVISAEAEIQAKPENSNQKSLVANANLGTDIDVKKLKSKIAESHPAPIQQAEINTNTDESPRTGMIPSSDADTNPITETAPNLGADAATNPITETNPGAEVNVAANTHREASIGVDIERLKLKEHYPVITQQVKIHTDANLRTETNSSEASEGADAAATNVTASLSPGVDINRVRNKADRIIQEGMDFPVAGHLVQKEICGDFLKADWANQDLPVKQSVQHFTRQQMQSLLSINREFPSPQDKEVSVRCFVSTAFALNDILEMTTDYWWDDVQAPPQDPHRDILTGFIEHYFLSHVGFGFLSPIKPVPSDRIDFVVREPHLVKNEQYAVVTSFNIMNSHSFEITWTVDAQSFPEGLAFLDISVEGVSILYILRGQMAYLFQKENGNMEAIAAALQNKMDDSSFTSL